MNAQSRTPSRRPTIGFIVEGLDDGYEAPLFHYCRQAAREAGANFVCMSGTILRGKELFGSPLQARLLERFVSSDMIDGIVFPSMILNLADEPDRARLVDAFKKKPSVSISLADAAIPCVECDNYAGMRAIVDHLIAVHGISRFAYADGNGSNYDYRERRRAFSDSLTTAGIPLDSVVKLSAQISVTDWDRWLIEGLVHDSDSIQAVVCIDDYAAEAVLRYFAARGRHAPYSIIVTGFDSTLGRTTIPRITSARQPYDEMCKRAIRHVLDVINGKAVEHRVLVPSELVLLESCGCRNHQSSERSATGHEESSSNLTDSFRRSIQDNAASHFLDALDIQIREGFKLGRDSTYWHDRLTSIGSKFSKSIEGADEQTHFEVLINRGRILIGDLMDRQSSDNNQVHKNKTEITFLLAEVLAQCDSPTQLGSVIANELWTHMAINNGGIIVFNDDAAASDAGTLLIENGRALPNQEQRMVTLPEYLGSLLQSADAPRSLICNLLKSWSEPMGMLVCEADIPELSVLTQMRNLVGNQIRHVRLIEQVRRQSDQLSEANTQLVALRAKEEEYLRTMRREIDLARQIQRDFLPHKLPSLDGWDMAVYFQPALEVAGDFYDIFVLPNGRTGIVIADVSGKSVSAAIFMALVRSLIRALSQTSHVADPLSAVSSVNDYIMKNHHGSGPMMFVTLFYGLLDQETGKLTYVNAGHPPPVITTHGRSRAFLNRTGPAVGIHEKSTFTIGSETLLPGDTLFAYTDGVTEAQGPAGVLLGKNTLYKVLERSLFAPQAIIDAVRSEIAAHSGEAAAFDDITMVAIQRME